MEVEFGEVEATRLAVRIVGEVDDDRGGVDIDLDVDLDGNAVGNAGKGIVRRVNDAPAGLEPPDRLDHLRLGIVEPGLGVAIELVPADFLAERQQLALSYAHRAE